METILPVVPGAEFFDCVKQICGALGITKIMLTGGEPTIHPNLGMILSGLAHREVSVTTNGIRVISVNEWTRLKESGLTKAIISVHDAKPEHFVSLEVRSRSIDWAERSLRAQRENIESASRAGLSVRINVVAYHSVGRVLDVVEFLADLHKELGFEIRILNDLGATERSQGYIAEVCARLGAEAIRTERRAGSSNVTTFYSSRWVNFSTKLAYPYFFYPVCSGCALKPCYEGFYGLRLERRSAGYFIRLCIYKQSGDVLMPWKSFLAGDLPQQLRQTLEGELSNYPA